MPALVPFLGVGFEDSQKRILSGVQKLLIGCGHEKTHAEDAAPAWVERNLVYVWPDVTLLV